ncbi:hypothetical protein GCM10011589_19760 [Modestobacter marinus]|uniref:5'-nucleotidase n=2 Tax=Modestobacter marinus TaxID=477641 RepID=A0ABQ2FXH5_9ACTN|nr:hypothetical protein GCM10011589_19760 [Modestobacter marinus]
MPFAHSMTARRAAAVTAVAVGGALLGASPALAIEPPAGSPFISEFHHDNEGTDANERVEVTAAPGTDLTGWTVVGVDGDGGAPYDAKALSGVVDESGTVVVDFTGLQDGGPDGIALVDPAGTVVQFLSYGGALSVTVGGSVFDSTDVGVTEDGSGPADGSVQLVDGVWVVTDTNTFGAANAVVEPTVPEPTVPEPTVPEPTVPEPGTGGEDDGTVDLQLLGINDFHGRLDDAVALAGTVEEQRAREDVDATLLLSAGDNIGASPFVSSSQQDAPTIEVLNELGLDASAVGNHEFDRGFADLTGRVGVDGESGLADFDYLGANVYGEDGEPVLPEYTLLDAEGVTVGVIGVVTEETSSLVSPAGIEGITFGDPLEATNRVTDELTDGVGDEADVIVLLAHEGAPEGEATSTLEEQLAADTAFAAIVAGADADVDAIFTGHTHQTYAWQAPVPGTDGTRPVIQTGSYAADLGRIVLSYEESTDEVTASTVENLALTEVPEEELVVAYPRVAEIAETVAAAQAVAEEVGSQVVGSVTADITRAFTTGPDGQPAEDRGSYSALGGLVADSYVYGAADSAIEPADLGLVNPGGLRADLLYGEDGVVTLAEANEVTPFANDLVVVSLTGAQLVQVLEQQWQPEGSSRPFLALGTSEELTWSYDPEAPPGERVIVDSIRVSGEPIVLDATYRVATNSFLASGGDNFTTFAEGTTEQTGLIDFDSFRAYLEENSPLSPEQFTGRVTVGDASEQPQQPAAEVAVSPSTFAPGDLVTFSVSGFGPAERVEVTVDGRRLGRVTTDAEGAATVRVRVPASVDSGTVEVTATGVTTGSTATVEVQVTEQARPGNGGTVVQKLTSWLRQLLGTWLR